MRRRSVIPLLIAAVTGPAVLCGQQGIYGEVLLNDGRKIQGLIRQSTDVIQITREGHTETFRRSQVDRIRITAQPKEGKQEPPNNELRSNPKAEAELLQAAGQRFRLKHTKHFVIAYDGDARDTAALSARLEATYSSIYRFCRMNDIAAVKPSEKLAVIYFDAYEDYARYARVVGFAFEGTHGFYYDRTNRAAFFNAGHDPQFLLLEDQLAEAHRNVSVLKSAVVAAKGDRVEVTFSDGQRRQMTKQQARQKIAEARKKLSRFRSMTTNYRERINRLVIQHESAHQALFNAGVHVRMAENPAWLAEGLACVFETPPSAAGAGIGVINQMRLYDFRAGAGDGNPHGALDANAYVSARKRGVFVDLRDLIADGKLFARRDTEAGYLYAQTWALAHYLQRNKRKELADYIRRIARRRPGQNISDPQQLRDFEDAFGKVDGRFERRWAGWILRQSFKPIEAGLSIEGRNP